MQSPITGEEGLQHPTPGDILQRESTVQTAIGIEQRYPRTGRAIETCEASGGQDPAIRMQRHRINRVGGKSCSRVKG